MPVLIQGDNGEIVVTSEADNMPIAIYDLGGWLISTSTTNDGITRVPVPSNEKMLIVKVGDKSVKVAIK
jgi:hypothetical protein